ncbi:GntR family transcriptional regulator [Streptomyces sp. NPDC001404]|uniref:GntR family transcriptional regulator n=1 Tax=Streptomyces sp. NPDC001404 TaxID=3364571 RepID=UPI0036AB1AAD
MSRSMPPDGPTAVYRLWDADEQLLYVGISHTPRIRYVQHEGNKPWWPAVHRRTEVWYDSREGAEAAERTAIGTEKPLHNRTDGNGANRPPLSGLSTHEPFESRRTVLDRLEADLRAGRYPQHRFLPTPVELSRKYGHAARDVSAALNELQRNGLVQRVDSNRYVIATPGQPLEETARGLMLREVIKGLGAGPFSRKDIRTLTGRSAFVVDRYVSDLLAEGRLESAGLLRPETGGRAVHHYVVPSSELARGGASTPTRP